jgi:dihydrofolate reductase
MKVIVYMAVTPNGMIARENDATDFVTKTEWKSFDRASRKAGNIVMGRRTFEIVRDDGQFPFKERLNVVMTRKKTRNKWGKDVVFTAASPRGVVGMLRRRGFKTVFVGGGGKVNSAFMRAGIVDEVFLDVEPSIIGKGIPLFAGAAFEKKLRLVGTRKLSPNEIQLRYKVVK